MLRSSDNPGLHRFAVFTAFFTLVLICAGGLVTSKEAGLAVPDWPNTYGYNMFFFPISKWVGNIFYEHTHRLVASGVGLLTVILAIWLARSEERRWLRHLGWILVVAVIFQGVLGGLRVTMLKDEIGIFHATLAQLFFVAMCAVALFTSRAWLSWSGSDEAVEFASRTRWLLLGFTLLTLVQLALGATMRHEHAGLAIPDFPTAYGKLWPATDPESIAAYNRARLESVGYDPITATGVIVQMLHRLVAFIILGWATGLAWLTARQSDAPGFFKQGTVALLGLVIAQVLLGAATIWTGKSADIATAHVAVGATTLALVSLLTIAAFGIAGASHRIHFHPNPNLAHATDEFA